MSLCCTNIMSQRSNLTTCRSQIANFLRASKAKTTPASLQVNLMRCTCSRVDNMRENNYEVSGFERHII